MALIIELTPEQEAALQEQAHAAGLEASEYVKDLIEQALPMPAMTPAQAVEYWQRQGLIGSYGDPNIDSLALARQLRSTVWTGREDNLAGEPFPARTPKAGPILLPHGKFPRRKHRKTRAV